VPISKPKADKRDVPLNILVSRRERREIDRAAKVYGATSVGDYLRRLHAAAVERMRVEGKLG